MPKFNNDWDNLLQAEFKKTYYLALRKSLIYEYNNYNVYPSMYDIYNAFKLTSFSETKVVIIGQDPYHNPNQAHGLAFSVLEPNPLPPSLKNIYTEIENEFDIKMSNSGDLTKWAKEGVLLLNTVLTVRENMPSSHKRLGWLHFTNQVINLLNERKDPIVFLLWGNDAKSKESNITNPWHYILKAAHPSPLSAYHGFFNCNHFIKANQILISLGKKPIDWAN